jgi:GntR family transcriptional regulator
MTASIISLGPRSGAIYQQIVEQIKRLVALRVLAPHDQLPTAKELASQLTINPNTVAHAYKELERAGIVELLAGKGTFVRADGARAAGRAGAKLIAQSLAALVKDAKAVDLSPQELRELFERALTAGYSGNPLRQVSDGAKNR